MMVKKEDYKTEKYFCPFFFPTVLEGMSLEDIPSCRKTECAMWVEWYDGIHETICGACGLVHKVDKFC